MAVVVIVKKWPFNCAYRVIGWPRALLNSILLLSNNGSEISKKSHSTLHFMI